MSNRSLLIGWRERWNRSLFQFLRRHAHATADVEDLAQETYLRLLRAQDLSEVRNPHAYLLGVANHVALDWRSQQPRADARVDLGEDMLVDEHPPELELDARRAERRLHEALDQASPTLRAVLLMRLRDERSCQDIARDLELTERQVRRYLERGYERLRAAMEN